MTFYDELAPYYHLLYDDWEHAVETQGAALHGLLQELGVAAGDAIHDAACGIGTQALGLAKAGYKLSCSDQSTEAIKRLSAEFSRRNLTCTAWIDDLRSLQGLNDESVSAVLACDNSLPHLLSDNEILQCLLACHRVLEPGGAVVFSVRDYATIPRRTPEVRPYGLRRIGDIRFLAVQVWKWDGDQYDVRMYLTTESPETPCATTVIKSRYYAIPVGRLVALMAEAGFKDIVRHDNVLFQPVLCGRRASVA